MVDRKTKCGHERKMAPDRPSTLIGSISQMAGGDLTSVV
jgi:hypothetical protein